ncbi:uncharacterized protein LOC132049094 [Lycium ferocissimum]|uniref:uncharacterized protein LOC132049094 n=1 Tax=Lycium ferocissimum TaxID=112874 RepID=UPI00281564C7|nr:uncharacterized protein LOC132049094 [Lycium ferocissimum]XP_059295741.1 uncharacterized protein LOC132049094 [Lycium ferocissimum]
METLSEEYAAFLKKVNRTIYIDNLSPVATESVVKAALDQFGNVIQVKFIPNYLEPKNIGQAALVELENPEQAKTIVSEISNSSFMVCGMPRPVKAQAAEAEMFDDRPRKPGRKIVCKWLDSSDPDFEVAKKIKLKIRKQAEEAKFLLKQQLEEEENLAKKQTEILNASYKKFELIDTVVGNRVADRLAERYRVRVADAEHQ